MGQPPADHSAAHRYVVFTNHTNARAIARGLAQLGLSHVWLDRGKPSEVKSGDVLFFTEEDSLLKNLPRQDVTFLPRALTFSVDDKVAFAHQSEAAGADTIPFALIGSDRLSPFGYPVVVKARTSWSNGRQVRRGTVCRSHEALVAWLDGAAQDGWSDDNFFLQRYLPDGVRNVVSVCGFFDWERPQRNAMIVCRKLSAKGSGFGSAARAVEIVSDPSDLVPRTSRLLGALRYTGPFELEFIHDEVGKPYVIELNARFWMQHGLFLRYFDNALIVRYLGRDSAADWSAFQTAINDGRQTIWLDSYGVLASLLRVDFSQVRFYLSVLGRAMRGARVMLDPPLPGAWLGLLRNLVLYRAAFPQRSGSGERLPI